MHELFWGKNINEGIKNMKAYIYILYIYYIYIFYMYIYYIYIYTMEYYSAIKMNEIWSFVDRDVDEPRESHTE